MNLFLNMRMSPVARFSFDNGWTISIVRVFDNYNIIIMPTIDNDKPSSFYDANPYYSDKAILNRGDFIENYGGTDDELLTVIGEVALRDNHSSLHTAGKLLDEFLTKRKT